MNKYTIWQVRQEFIREFGFRSLESIKKEFPDRTEHGLPKAAWWPVYVYETVRKPSLDTMYIRFQWCLGETPKDFTGHSMSVSDIVETPDGKLWFCDSFGWREIQWSEEVMR